MPEQRLAVLVTGSSGLLGQPLGAALAEHGYEVFGLDCVEPPEASRKNEHVHHIDCDLTQEESVQKAVTQVRERSGGRLASVVHMAAYYDFSGEDSPMYEEITVKGTDRLLAALRDVELEQFIFTSTMLVHQPCEPGSRIDERSPLEAKWPYPESKIETERLIRERYPDVRSVFLRIAGVYTDFGRQPTLVQQIKRIYEMDFQSYFFPGDAETGQSSVYLDDAVDAIVRTVERRRQIEPKTAILIGEPDPPTYEMLQDEIGQRLHGTEWLTVCVPKLLAKAGASVSDTLSGGEAFIKPFMVSMADDHYALDISRAKELLDWEPQQRLLNRLPGMIDRLKKDPDAWYQQNGIER